MKRCPTCRLLFVEDALNYCRFDGAPLSFDKALTEAPTVPLTVRLRDENYVKAKRRRDRSKR